MNCRNLLVSEGFKTGQAAFKTYLENPYAIGDYENPFDPSHSNYEDYWDGWSWERDSPKTCTTTKK